MVEPVRGYRYVLMCVDSYSGWPEACVTKKEDSTSVVKFLINQYIPRHGFPKKRSRLEPCLKEKRTARKEAEEELLKQNLRIDNLKSIVQNYVAHIQVDKEKIKALEERIAASASERTAPSIDEKMAPHVVKEKKLEHEE
ncbi:hypothetical protein MHYP_G00107940 [Metynnis hypsauchen]